MKALALVFLTACGGAGAAPVGPPAPSATPDAAPPAAADALPTLVDLASRAPEVAPGMRELARGESTHAEVLHAAPVDTCIRVVFAATAAVSVRVESSTGAPLAAVDASLGGVLAPRGPVCVRRGDGVRLSVDGASTTRVRWVAWGTP